MHDLVVECYLERTSAVFKKAIWLLTRCVAAEPLTRGVILSILLLYGTLTGVPLFYNQDADLR